MSKSRRKADLPELPFAVNKGSGVSLSRQIADGIRSAIASGFYKPGRVLPTRKEFAKALGVSERAPREAVALLAVEGLVYTRRCLGCVVAETGERHWLGKVLLVETDYASGYYYAVMFESFVRRMNEAGYTVTRIPCPIRTGKVLNTVPLQDALQQAFDLVVSLQIDRRIVDLIKKSTNRCLVFSFQPQGRDWISIDVDRALRDLVAQCQRRHVRSVVQVGLRGVDEVLDLRAYVPHTGMDLTSWDITIGCDRVGAENITYGVMQAFMKRLALDRKWLPDLLFFRDDFVAVGALAALLQAGVRVPEDVRIVTLSNRGNCPVFPKSLARIELDPERNGIVWAERVLQVLAPGRFKGGGDIAYQYIPGATFP